MAAAVRAGYEADDLDVAPSAISGDIGHIVGWMGERARIMVGATRQVHTSRGGAAMRGDAASWARARQFALARLEVRHGTAGLRNQICECRERASRCLDGRSDGRIEERREL